MSRRWASSLSSSMKFMVTKFTLDALASSTKSFHASGWSSVAAHTTLCTSSPTWALKRRMPCPSMKATMSSLRLCRSWSMESQEHHIALKGVGLYRKFVVNQRQSNGGLTTRPVAAVCELQGAPVPFCDLPAQDQSYSASAVLRGKERHKQIVRVKKPRSLIPDKDFNAPAPGTPSDLHRAWLAQ